MTKNIFSFILAVIFLTQTAFVAWAGEMPKVSFYESAGWLDHLSNTMRQVAQRGEQGAYKSYKNNNPAPRNAYERVNIHQANLTDLRLYQNSPIYHQARQIRDAFVGDYEEEPATQEELSEDALQEVRLALQELMGLYKQYGAYYPIVTQAVLEISRQVLPMQKQYRLFAAQDLPVLKALFQKILQADAQCREGEGYRLFCEGRADALDGFAVLAQTSADAALIADVLKKDIQQPYIYRELFTGTSALMSLNQERRLEPVLEEAIDEEGESFWQKIDVFMTNWWVDKVQYRNGRYMGNVTSVAVLPGLYDKADGNAWEEVARLLYNDGNPSQGASYLLSKYGLGSCEVDQFAGTDGTVLYGKDKTYRMSVKCKTLLPFLTGALASGFRKGADAQLRQAAGRLHMTPASLVARLYFEHDMGDLNAETELRLDNLFYGVFKKDFAALEQARKKALEHNSKIDEQIRPLMERRMQLLPQLGYVLPKKGETIPEGWLVDADIAALNKKKMPVPVSPNVGFQNYTRQSDTYRSKVTGDKIYNVVRQVSGAVDMGLGIYYTAALPVMTVKGIKWTVSIKRGFDAVRAGRVTADARRLASLSARLKKIRAARISLGKSLKNNFYKNFANLREEISSLGVQIKTSVKDYSASAKKTTGGKEPANQTASYQKTTSAVVPSPTVTKRPLPKLRQLRLTEEATGKSVQLNAQQAKEWHRAAVDIVKQMKQIRQKWQGDPTALMKEMEGNTLKLKEALEEALKYSRLEKDLLFYQQTCQASGLPVEEGLNALSSQRFLFSSVERTHLGGMYVRALRREIKNLPPGNEAAQAQLWQQLYAAVSMADEVANPATLIKLAEGRVPLASMRTTVRAMMDSGKLSAVQQKEAADIWRKLQTFTIDEDLHDVLSLRIMNLTYLQDSPNTLWIWGVGMSGDELLARKTPLGFPMAQMFYDQPFSSAVPFINKQGENVIFVNGHGYISKNGMWKVELTPPTFGDVRPTDTFTAEKVVRALDELGYPKTSVFLYSCYSGHIFLDLQKLFKVYPQAAQRTQWFTITAPMQKASAEIVAERAVSGSVTERMFDKMMFYIRNNGSGLAARAWVEGRDVFPLKYSINRIGRQIAQASGAEKKQLIDLRNELKDLLTVAQSSTTAELAEALDMFKQKYPNNLKHWEVGYSKMPRGAMVDYYSWGLAEAKTRVEVTYIPFIRLEERWVNYVAQSAEEMFGRFKSTGPMGKSPALNATLDAATQAEQDLAYAAQRWPVIEKMKENNASGWTETLLQDDKIRNLQNSLQYNYQKMEALRKKWDLSELNLADDIGANLKLSRDFMQDITQYIQLERQSQAGQKLFDLYNKQAGFDTWKLLEYQPSKMLTDKNYKNFSKMYLQDLNLRKNYARTAQEKKWVEEEIRNVTIWNDRILFADDLAWNPDILQPMPVMRTRLLELEKQKDTFSAGQQAELAELDEMLFSGKKYTPLEKMTLQNRILFLPKWEKTPNTLFWWGDNFNLSEVWNRKTFTGFGDVHYLNNMDLEQMKSFVKSNQENVFLFHVPGGISSRGVWKGISVMMPKSRHTFKAEDVINMLEETTTAQNTVYINGCFSGWFIKDLLPLRFLHKDLFARSNFFTNAAILQHGTPEVLPAKWAQGTAMEKMFDKILQRMTFNGDAIGARMLVDGKLIYPLDQSVRRLDEAIKTASQEKRAELLALRTELAQLREVADASTPSQLANALTGLEKIHPGSVIITVPDEVKFMEELGFQVNDPSVFCMNGFYWGLDKQKFAADITEPYVLLQPKWVNYVAETAKEMFAQTVKKHKAANAAPVATPEL